MVQSAAVEGWHSIYGIMDPLTPIIIKQTRTCEPRAADSVSGHTKSPNTKEYLWARENSDTTGGITTSRPG